MSHDPTEAGTSQSGGGLLCDRYRLEHQVAHGGMGEVWQATDTLLQRQVAVKLLHPHLRDDPAVAARFRREARAAARLHHPAIVPVYDICSTPDGDAIILQFIEGPTLRHYLDRAGRLTNEQAMTVGCSVADALWAAHQADIVHRDVKPANILFGPDRAMLTDFGVAKALDEADHTATGTMLGSVRYLSPEQVEGGGIDGRSDIFSLGVVLYECVTGTTPWTGDGPTAVALARLGQPAGDPRQHNPDVTPQLAATIGTCLQRDPDDRFPDAAALAVALGASGVQPPPPNMASPQTDPTSATAIIQMDDGDIGDGGIGEGGIEEGDGPQPVVATRHPLLPMLIALTAIVVLVVLMAELVG